MLSATFSPDGSVLVAGLETGELMMWDATTGEALTRFALHDEGIGSVDVLPGRDAIISMDGLGGVQVLDLSAPARVAAATLTQNDVAFDVPSPGRRALQLADLAMLRGDWTAAVAHHRQAARLGAAPVALERARALWVTGAHDEAREVLEAAQRADQILPATRALWAGAH